MINDLKNIMIENQRTRDLLHAALANLNEIDSNARALYEDAIKADQNEMEATNDERNHDSTL